MEFTKTTDEIVTAIKSYNAELPNATGLQIRLSNNVSWYFTEIEDEYLYGPSKWVGYKDLDSDTYIALTKDKQLGGQLTEVELKPLRREITQGSTEHVTHLNRLTRMLAKYGKTPNKRVRFNEVLHTTKIDVSEVDKADKLVSLLIEVIKTLPEAAKDRLKRELG